MSNSNKWVLGVDIGGVVIDRVADSADTSFFGKNYLQTPSVPGVMEALAKLVLLGFRVHLVSKCGESVQGKTRKWLTRHNFYQLTGVAQDDVHFCLTRPEKSAICDSIGATHFVDDRLEVLSYLRSVPHRYLLNAVPSEVESYKSALTHVVRVDDWAALVTRICEDSEASAYSVTGA